MADSTIDIANIFLYDTFASCGVAIEYSKIIPPADVNGAIFTNSNFHNVDSERYARFTKIQVRNVDYGGYTGFIYLQYGTGSGVTSAAKHCCLPQVAAAPKTHWDEPKVSNDHDTAMEQGPGCVTISAMTDDYWGWFWCSGPAPLTLVAAMTGNMLTDDAILADSALVFADLAANQIGLSIGLAAGIHHGYSLAAD